MNAPNYKKILVPVDGSNHSFKAVVHAGYLASAVGAEVGLLYVLQAFSNLQIYPEVGFYYMPEQIYETDREFGKKVLQEAAIALPTGIKTSAYLENGSPAEVIPEFAAENRYDLIVIGSRGLGVFKELVLGSVSHHVLHHATCPVLVIK